MSGLHVLNAWLQCHLNLIRTTGIVFLGLGIILNFANLKGLLTDPDRRRFLDWVLNSRSGLPLTETAAQEFMRRFPAPEGTNVEKLTHVTKTTIGHELGGMIQNASINYMHSDGKRTAYVANLADIRVWAAETPYPWLAWWLSVFGFIEITVSYLIEWRKKHCP